MHKSQIRNTQWRKYTRFITFVIFVDLLIAKWILRFGHDGQGMPQP